MKSAFKTDTGRVRTVNEDRIEVLQKPDGTLLVLLADGMGGHQAGDTASQTAIDTVKLFWPQSNESLLTETSETLLREAVQAANRKVYSLAVSNASLQGMGTTLVAAYITNSCATIAHIGDSRAYVFRDGILQQLTDDHSLVNELRKSGQISDEEALVHPRRNVLTRALGTEPEIEVDVQHFDLIAEDLLMFCTDGLSNMISDSEISTILKSSHRIEQKVNALIDRALELGGDDNVSVVLVEISSENKQ